MVGQTIGKYQLLDRLGRGGVGAVYRALDTTLQREVAIKLLNAELTDPEVARRFQAEAVTVARLSHPGIARVFELFEHDGRWLMVMEFVRGETLERMVARLGPLPAVRAADLATQVLEALAHAHEHGVVHRDLKPANLMATRSGSVKVMDFGIARVAGAEQMTQAGNMLGTPAFMAPEQVSGGEIDARADLYSMGLVLYHLVTAAMPFQGDSPMALARARLEQDPKPVDQLRPNLPAWLNAVITRALARAPADRFQTADSFRAALVHGMAGLALDFASPAELPPELVATLAPGTVPVVSAGTPAAVATSTSMSPPTSSSESVAPVVVAADRSAGSPAGLTPSQAAADLAPSTAASEVRAAASLGVPPKLKRRVSSVAAVAVAAVVIALGILVVRQLWPATPATVMPPFPPAPLPQEPAAAGVSAGREGGPEPGLSAAAPIPPVDLGPARPTGSPATPPGPDRPAPGRAAPAGEAPGGPVTPPAAGRSGRAARSGDEPVVFEDAKLLTVNGRVASERDVLLRVGRGAIIAIDRTTGEMFGSMGYADLVSGTYVKARGPKWDATLSAPPANLDRPGGFLGLRSSQHWLVLQGRKSYLMLVLAESQFATVLDLITRRTGKPIARPAQVP